MNNNHPNPDPPQERWDAAEAEKRIREKRKNMETAAKALDFLVAAKLRDEIKELQEFL